MIFEKSFDSRFSRLPRYAPLCRLGAFPSRCWQGVPGGINRMSISVRQFLPLEYAHFELTTRSFALRIESRNLPFGRKVPSIGRSGSRCGRRTSREQASLALFRWLGSPSATKNARTNDDEAPSSYSGWSMACCRFGLDPYNNRCVRTGSDSGRCSDLVDRCTSTASGAVSCQSSRYQYCHGECPFVQSARTTDH